MWENVAFPLRMRYLDPREIEERVAAALFTFLVAFDEIVIAIFISGAERVTLPRKMFEGIEHELNPTVAAVSTLLIGFVILMMLLVEMARKRSAQLQRGR